MAQPNLAEQLTRLESEFHDCEEDAIEQPKHGCQDAEFQAACHELKRRKFMYLAAESELRLLQSCHKSELAYLQQTQERESARIEAKKVLRELKHEGERQREINEELYSQIAQLVAETEAARDRCAHDIREAQRLQADMEEEDKDMQPRSLLEDAEMDATLQAPQDDDNLLMHNAENLAGMVAAQVEEETKQDRKRFEAECLRRNLREVEARRTKMEQLEEEARAKVIDLEGHMAEMEELGLPRITFDDSAGTVILGWPPRTPVPRGDDVAVRTVSVNFNEQGQLVDARVHPSLELWDEASLSIEKDDLARLLTLVWDKVCQLSDGRLAREFGGA